MTPDRFARMVEQAMGEVDWSHGKQPDYDELRLVLIQAFSRYHHAVVRRIKKKQKDQPFAVYQLLQSVLNDLAAYKKGTP